MVVRLITGVEGDPTELGMNTTPTLMPLVLDYVTRRVRTGDILPATGEATRTVLAGLAACHGRRPVARFGPATIDRYRASISKLRASTQREYLSKVRGFCRWLVLHGHVKRDPCADLPSIRQPRRIPVTLTNREVRSLLDATADDLRATAIVWLMVGLGLRCVEVTRLQMEDYDPGHNGQDATIRVIGKGGHERLLPVPKAVQGALDAYLESVGRVSGPMIRSEVTPTTALAPNTLGKYTRRWLRAAGVKGKALDGRSAHGLRRTAGSDVMAATGNIQVVQAMLGHARIETTAQHYLRPVTVAELREAMEGRTYDTTTELGETG